MKKTFKPFLFSIFLVCFMAFAQTGLAQVAPQPPSAGQKGDGGNKGPGGAPIDGGVAVSLAMAAGYGAWKWLKAKQKKREPAER